MHYECLRELYVADLIDLYAAEHQINRALPRVIQCAQSVGLKRALQKQLDESGRHLDHLSKILHSMNEAFREKTCGAMQVLLHEVHERICDGGDTEIMDAGLITAMQRVVHYTIAAYSSARTYAEHLTESDAARFLSETLDDEMRADLRLSQLAHRVHVVRRAA